MMIKKLVGIILGILFGVTFVLAKGDYKYPYDNYPDGQGGTDQIDKIIKGQTVDDSNSLLNELISSFGIKYSGDSKVVYYVTYLINTFLGLLVFISLVYMIYGFYMVFFSPQDDAFAKAKKIIISSVIALLVIGFSWYILSFVFDLFFKIRG